MPLTLFISATTALSFDSPPATSNQKSFLRQGHVIAFNPCTVAGANADTNAHATSSVLMKPMLTMMPAMPSLRGRQKKNRIQNGGTNCSLAKCRVQQTHQHLLTRTHRLASILSYPWQPIVQVRPVLFPDCCTTLGRKVRQRSTPAVF